MKYVRLLTWILLTVSYGGKAQELSFFRLDNGDGLSDNTVTSVVMDRNGLLWIGTQHGLNSYDGYSIRNFYSREYPGLQNDAIVRMACDEQNRIWIQCGQGKLTMLDEKREFHAIDLQADGKRITVDYWLPTTKGPMFLHDGRVYGLADESTLQFGPLAMPDQPLLRNTFNRINTWDENHLVFSGNDLFFLFDLNTLNVSAVAHAPGIIAAARLTDDLAIATSADGQLYQISCSKGKIIHRYRALRDQYGEAIHRTLGSIQHLQDEQLLITSSSAGLYLFDAKTRTLTRHQHDVFDSNTLSTNQTTYMFSSDGDFHFVATASAGLNYFKRNAFSAKSKAVFEDIGVGRRYYEYISGVAEDAEGTIWMAGLKTLIAWERTTDRVTLHPFSENPARDHWGGIRALHIDKQDRIWLGLSDGLAILNRKNETIGYLNEGVGLPDNHINAIIDAPDGTLWVCTRKGIGLVDPETFRIRSISQDSPLKAVQGLHCNTAWFRTPSDVWIGTRTGAYRTDLSTGTTQVLTTTDGLAFDDVIGFAGDTLNRMYIGTRFGFHIVEQGKPIRTYYRINTAWPVDCHALIRDKDGDIWFANNDYLAVYSPTTGQFKVYDENVGINPSGFRFYAAHATRGGELLFGTNKGITYFRPENIRGPDFPISVMIHEMETRDSVYFAASQEPLTSLPYPSRTVSFSFSAVNLLRGKNVHYRYKLEGIESDWGKTTFGNRVTYSHLGPGHYHFHVKASADGLNWVEAPASFAFRIQSPWWQRRWFLAASLLAVCGTALLIGRQRTLKIRTQREQLETERTINYLASSLHEQTTVEAILWDVAKNCIGRLKFEDCVIYLKDEERNVLLQKAAWGPKTTEGNKIVNPIEIPVGMGIVGSVAASGKAEIIPDTTKDTRYIVDDAVRQSEITVPIVYNGRIMGIIDSEHTEKRFFTQKHLSILTTIAALCANKIARLSAEEATQKAQLELLEHERKAMEAQLKSLRLQMNPHFLFNSLNAIQQMILAGDDIEATRYLAKFSRLLRQVLTHSDKETVMLKEELETLRLYVELESLRFKEAFHYDIACDDGIDPEEIKIPAMLIQPFVENAIWHGLLHKEGDRYLKIVFSEDATENLVCTIEDNGVGRTAAGKVTNGNHTGKGIAVAAERLKTHSAHHRVQNKVWIHDLVDGAGNAAGTKVMLILPLLS